MLRKAIVLFLLLKTWVEILLHMAMQKTRYTQRTGRASVPRRSPDSYTLAFFDSFLERLFITAFAGDEICYNLELVKCGKTRRYADGSL